MRTTATNRKLRLLLTGIRDGNLVPNPDFQRRLVWTNKDKRNFLDTVLRGYPFPEIYIAAGTVNPQTGEGSEMLVDGQQRITTLYQYFAGARELRLGSDLMPYKKLSQEQQIAFLEYEVVVRDLGTMGVDEIKEVFRRINATSYSLNAMEIHNARFNGEFKTFAQYVAQLDFFGDRHVFSATEIRRMRDVSFALVLIITIMSGYFNREDELETYLETYNDDFPQQEQLKREISRTLDFVDACGFDSRSRAWKLSDLLTLLVEVYRAIIRDGTQLEPSTVSRDLNNFYARVDEWVKGPTQLPMPDTVTIAEYARAASQATNDRGSRIKRGDIIRNILLQPY